MPTFEETLSPKKHGNQSFQFQFPVPTFEETCLRRSTPISLFNFNFRCQRLKQRCLRRSTAISLIQFQFPVPTFETTLSPKKHGNQSYSFHFKFKFRCQRWNNAVSEETRQSVLFNSIQIKIPVPTFETTLFLKKHINQSYSIRFRRSIRIRSKAFWQKGESRTVSISGSDQSFY